MTPKAVLLFCMILIGRFAHAQTAGAVFDQYLDFNYARLQQETPKALTLGEKILPDAALLPAKSRISFYNGLAKVYEDTNQPAKAITYYEIVEKAEPGFYVVHRALGYLYSSAAEEIYLKLHATADQKEKRDFAAQYSTLAHKALPHLEKAQACDPSNDTLELIKTYYNNLKDKEGLDGLKQRLTAASKNCIDVLSDQ